MLTVKRFTFNPVQENTYVLSDQKDACCIVDPGCYFEEEREALREYFEQEGLTPSLLLNTHCHLDHVFGNKFVHETWGLLLHLHQKERALLEVMPEYGVEWGLPFENYEGELVFIPEGEILRWGGAGAEGAADRTQAADRAGAVGKADAADILKALFLPGHSPGSLGFYCEAQGFIIGGDVLFREGIGRTDLPGGDHGTLLHSIRQQLWTLPDDTIVYPGHGEPTTIGWEKAHNPFL
jgi:hydroxyacylglutathione hydrolase